MQNKKKLKIKKASQPIQWLNESKQKIEFEKPFWAFMTLECVLN